MNENAPAYPVKAVLDDVVIYRLIELGNSDERIIVGKVRKHDIPLWKVGDSVALGPAYIFGENYALYGPDYFELRTISKKVDLSVFHKQFMRDGVGIFGHLTTRWDRKTRKLNYE